MKRFLLIVLCQLIFWVGFAQNDEVEKLIDQGVALQNHGLYHDAISKYNQALAKDKNNLRAQYEMSYSYLELENYDKAIYYSFEVVRKKTSHYLDACMVYGAALDYSGKAKGAIRFYRKVISEYPNEYLLYYNLGLSYYKNNETEEAEKCVEKAIQLNKLHMSSHLLLSSIMQAKGERLKSMLPLYYFLLFEQDSKRSVDAYNQLQNLWTLSAIHKGNTVAISVGLNPSKAGMSALELGVGTIAAGYLMDEKDLDSEPYLKMAEQTQDLFTLMKEVDVADLDFFALTYIDFFKMLTTNEHEYVYSYYISNCAYKEKVLAWLTENNGDFSKFMEWMELQQ
ncbi:tetratricopeptide repeat protein [Carboxylicivirga caseinilyticus]|uniref:tetratricopeptide repeat protein n=1 Tax=Carboxylicivirga caseinilyticus TaxID=3417572 RepID=UPI003D3351DC|nr:tetratricopeptide repeat protein [Marinilabiliaceae bacterium A049]